jgi:hypothetical protein
MSILIISISLENIFSERNTNYLAILLKYSMYSILYTTVLLYLTKPSGSQLKPAKTG